MTRTVKPQQVAEQHIEVSHFGDKFADICTCCQQSCYAADSYSDCCNERTERYALRAGRWVDALSA
jgi:hypothetical protein